MGVKGNPKVLAVASGGGHWIQLFRLRTAWDGCSVTYVTTTPGYRDQVAADARARSQDAPDYRVVPDANRWQKLRLMRQFLTVAVAVLRTRPDVVVSTGAAPGFFAVWVGRHVGARTIWVDSIANAEELSLSGHRAGAFSDLWLTQWEHLAEADATKRGPRFRGAVV